MDKVAYDALRPARMDNRGPAAHYGRDARAPRGRPRLSVRGEASPDLGGRKAVQAEIAMAA